MRLLVVTVVHHPLDARVFSREIGAMRLAGHHVVYAAPWTATGTTPPPGVEPIDLPRSSGRARLRAMRAARDAMTVHGPAADLILIHNPELIPVVPRRLRDKTIWDVHEDVPVSLVDKDWIPGAIRPIASGAVGMMESWAEKRFHVLLAEDSYQERFRRSHPVVPNDPLVPEFCSDPLDDRVIHLGRHSRGRGVGELAAVGRNLPDGLRLVLLGPADTNVEGEMEDLAQEPSVEWTGRIENEQALSIVEGSMAGLSLLHDLPNYRHSRPTKILEYMSRGVPVITTPLPVAAGIVERYECGIVVPFGDPLAVIDAISGLREDVDGRRAMGQRGHSAALDHFNWERSGQEFVSQLESWAGLNRRPHTES